ncbi:MAG: sigma-54 dependent transcriptional regulator [Desulfobacterales bacterium]|nr:sigma-54 dependent transcriptional regulator [Desulfobacterales bacterium]
MQIRLLIVEDEQEMLLFLKRFFTRKGYAVTGVASAEEAVGAFAETEYDLVISDLALADMNGLDLLKAIRVVDPVLPFIIITGAGTIETAVEAIQSGAFHYLTKPFKRKDLEILVKRAVEFGLMHRRLSRMHEAESARERPLIMGENREMQQVVRTVEKVARSDTSVLIEGETGTGKSLLARHIHQTSLRGNGPFITIDCGALPENLLESELFGHVKGAFTGAVRAKRGLMEEAHQGTVFLDEIGELKPATQVKLLRAIQEKKIRPVGSNQTTCIDVRFICATNRELTADVAKGRFREDLYYRLAVIPILLPPLRRRREDLLRFVGHFVREFNRRHNKTVSSLSPDVWQAILDYQWKGNIRELKNVIERAVLLTDGPMITADGLGIGLMESRTPGRSRSKPISLKKAVAEAERTAIRRALHLAKGNRSTAAVFLGIGRRTLYDKLKLYGIETDSRH